MIALDFFKFLVTYYFTILMNYYFYVNSRSDLSQKTAADYLLIINFPEAVVAQR